MKGEVECAGERGALVLIERNALVGPSEAAVILTAQSVAEVVAHVSGALDALVGRRRDARRHRGRHRVMMPAMVGGRAGVEGKVEARAKVTPSTLFFATGLPTYRQGAASFPPRPISPRCSQTHGIGGGEQL